MTRVARSRSGLFQPPRFLAPPLAGIDLSASGIKIVRLVEHKHGLVLDRYAYIPLSPEVIVDGEIVDKAAVVRGLVNAGQSAGITAANVALPESKSYLFETVVHGTTKEEERLYLEQHLEELVPLPPAMALFDTVSVGPTMNNETPVVGVAFARRVVDEMLAVFDEAGITVRSLEAETFPMIRSLLPSRDETTVLVIDIGKTTTKICIASHGVPRFTTTIGMGGHALTLAIQKHFGVTEDEAQKIKLDQGITPAPGNEELLEAMLSTIAAIRDEILNRLEYWQTKGVSAGAHEAVSHAILIGGNATMKGFTEYLEQALHIPVTAGNVFTNFAPRDTWLPPLEYNESLSYTAAIGLALRDYSV
jgi:type IV pilus assembly protein PilM